jgi:hypothetical protein
MCSGAIRKPAIATLIIWIVVVEWVGHFSLSLLRLQYPSLLLAKSNLVRYSIPPWKEIAIDSEFSGPLAKGFLSER